MAKHLVQLTPRHEKFVVELVRLTLLGDRKARAKAYIAADFAPKNAASNGRRLANEPLVKTRYAEVYAEECEGAKVRRESIVLRIDRVGRANLVDFYEPDTEQPGKVRLRDLTKLPRELTEALEAIKYTEDGRVELKLLDKNQANFTLLKHFGGLPEADGPRQVVNIYNALSVDDQAALADFIEALPGGQTASGGEPARERETSGALPPPV